MPLNSVKQLKSYIRVIWNVALISSLNSLNYDGANDFSFLKRKYTRKYGLMAWSNYSAKFIEPLCWAKILDGGSSDSLNNSLLFWPESLWNISQT